MGGAPWGLQEAQEAHSLPWPNSPSKPNPCASRLLGSHESDNWHFRGIRQPAGTSALSVSSGSFPQNSELVVLPVCQDRDSEPQARSACVFLFCPSWILQFPTFMRVGFSRGGTALILGLIVIRMVGPLTHPSSYEVRSCMYGASHSNMRTCT